MLLLACLALYGGASLFGFLLYAFDKRAARRGESRVPEIELHLLALACGWPGAWLGQQVFRHKTQKRRFRLIFFCMAITNCLMLAAALFFLT